MLSKSSANSKNSFFTFTTPIQPSRQTEQLDELKGKLNSDRIKALFGNYGVELLYQEGSTRISNLHSNGVMRTCAIVSFSQSLPVWLQETHDKIFKGGSIGQTIIDSGFTLTKENIFVGNSELPNTVKERMDTQESAGAVHVYQLMVEKPGTMEKILYCTITEVHSPCYLTLGDIIYLSPTDMTGIIENRLAAQEHLSALGDIDTTLSQNKIDFQ